MKIVHVHCDNVRIAVYPEQFVLPANIDDLPTSPGITYRDIPLRPQLWKGEMRVAAYDRETDTLFIKVVPE